MSQNRVRYKSLPVAVLIISSLHATIVPALDLVSLTSHADIIAIGEVNSVLDRGPTTLDLDGGAPQAMRYVAHLRVDQILKGSSLPEILALDFVMPEMPIGIQGVTTGQYGLFFLTKDPSMLRCTDPVYPSLPALRNTKLPPTAVLDQVTAVLGQVLESLEVSDSERFRALDALGGLNTDFARDTLRHALASPSRDIRLDVARTLVARNDLTGLAIVEDALLHPSGLSDIMRSNLAGSLGGLKDPNAVPALKRLLETNDQNIIEGAAIALRQSGSADALEPLSRLLTNSDERVRYYAVVGLGEITKQDEWTPSFPEFRERGGKYLSYWQGWAASNVSPQSRQ